jgi:hypothetical protein
MAVMLLSCLSSTWCNRRSNASPPQCAVRLRFRAMIGQLRRLEKAAMPLATLEPDDFRSNRPEIEICL